MRKLSLDNLLQKDIKLVEKKKIFFFIPLGIILLAIIFAFIWWPVRGSAVNLSMDFTGGHVIQINAGNSINENNIDGHIDNVYNFLSTEEFYFDGEHHTVNINRRDITTLGAVGELTIRVQFRAPRAIPTAYEADWMEDVTDQLADHLNSMFGRAVPVVSTHTGNQVWATYNMPILAHAQRGFFEQMLREAGIGFVPGSVEAVSVNGSYTRLVFNYTGTVETADLINALTIANPFFGQAVPHAAVSGTVSSALIISAIAAVLWALVFMLGYIIIRFEFASGIAIIVALVHDMIIMFAFIIIFNIEISSTFIAIIITVLAYSINNSIIIFDRIRENRSMMFAKNKNVTANEIANKSVVETLGRNISTTVTTIIMIAMMAIVTAIGGITDMVAFSLPITIGFLAGLFSSTCLAPSIWSIIRKNNLEPRKGIRKQTIDDKPKVVVSVDSMIMPPQPQMAINEE
ncbi:MAG: hypothetical protein FWE03_06065 [Firmicutes bacterium]|nr:hypothetical protein [Bacillota bacterium]